IEYGACDRITCSARFAAMLLSALVAPDAAAPPPMTAEAVRGAEAISEPAAGKNVNTLGPDGPLTPLYPRSSAPPADCGVTTLCTAALPSGERKRAVLSLVKKFFASFLIA